MYFPKDKLKFSGSLSLIIPLLIVLSLIFIDEKFKFKFTHDSDVFAFIGLTVFALSFAFPLFIGIALIYRYFNCRDKTGKSGELAQGTLNIISLLWLFILWVIYLFTGMNMRTF